MARSLTRFFSILLVLGMILSMMPAAVFAADTKLYLKPHSNWLEAGARFAAYYWNTAGSAWSSMTDSNSDGYYEVSIPSGYPNVIFCRMNPATTTNDWANVWDQTSDLTIPTNGNNC